MSILIKDGDYAVCDGKTVETAYIDALLQSVQMMLKLPRKKYYPDKDYGSFLYSLKTIPCEDRILSLARQALSAVDGVFVKSVSLDGRNCLLTVVLNGEERQVKMEL